MIIKLLLLFMLFVLPANSFAAWASVGARGVNNSASVGTTLVVTIATANVTAGNILIVCFAFDNTVTVDGATTEVSVTDSGGNTYTRIAEYQNTNGGVAADGAAAALFYSVISTGLTSGSSTVTITHSSLISRAVSLHEFGVAGGSTVSVQSSNGAGFDTATVPTVTLSGLPSSEYLFIGVLGEEQGSSACSGITADADYTTIAWTYANGGTNTTSIALCSGYRIATLTGDTYNPTSSVSRDHSILLGALLETLSTAVPVFMHHYFQLMGE